MIRASAPSWKHENLPLAAAATLLSFPTILRLQNNRVSLLTHHHQGQKHTTDSSMEIVSWVWKECNETYSLTCSNSFIQKWQGAFSLSLFFSLFFTSNFGNWNQCF
jgi:hypothetical protein